MILSKCAMCGSKKLRFIKNQEARELLNSLGLKTPLNKVPIWGYILFWEYKMNKIVNKFSLAGDKFLHEMHVKQLGFTYGAYGPFTKNKETIQKFEETWHTNYIYRNLLKWIR